MSRYFDAASGLPMSPRARQALDAALDRGWADPARLHRDGRVARQLLDAGRAAVASCLGALPQEVSFTASGTDALTSAILGIARGRARVGSTVLASAVERSVVLRAADWAGAPGEPLLAPVNSHAQVELEAFAELVRTPRVAVAAVQHVNHEIGTVQPLAEVHAVTREHGVPLVVDASASLGTLPPPRHWDALVGSAHKWGGPAGVGVLALRTGVRWRSPTPADGTGGQVGFPNVPAIVAAAAALEQASADLSDSAARRARLLARLLAEVPRAAAEVLPVGPPDLAGRAPHIATFTVMYADGGTLVGELDRAGFAVASGSACTADTRRPSHVLAAMGVMTHGNLRVSLPPDATDRDVSDFLAVLPGAIAAARAAADTVAR